MVSSIRQEVAFVLVQERVTEIFSGEGNDGQKMLLYAVAEAAINRRDESGIADIVDAYTRITGEQSSALSIGRRLAGFAKGSEPILLS